MCGYGRTWTAPLAVATRAGRVHSHATPHAPGVRRTRTSRPTSRTEHCTRPAPARPRRPRRPSALSKSKSFDRGARSAVPVSKKALRSLRPQRRASLRAGAGYRAPRPAPPVVLVEASSYDVDERSSRSARPRGAGSSRRAGSARVAPMWNVMCIPKHRASIVQRGKTPLRPSRLKHVAGSDEYSIITLI